MALSHPDHDEYRALTMRQRIDRAIHTCEGLLKGISIDDKLNAAEIAELLNWCNEHRDLVDRSPFNEIVPKLDSALADGIIDPEEQEDLLWVCKNLSVESEYYDSITNDIQRLHGILHGILADGEILIDEAIKLQNWVDEHEHLKGVYPYDELDSILLAVLKDNEIDDDEHKILKAFFEDFIDYSFAKKMANETKRIKGRLSSEFTLPGVCASCPSITFNGKTFTFTGVSALGKRQEVFNLIENLSGKTNRNLTQETDFLVIGSDGNPCWAFSCYGRKVEHAVGLRKGGHPILIIHESDFWDAVEDHGGQRLK